MSKSILFALASCQTESRKVFPGAIISNARRQLEIVVKHRFPEADDPQNQENKK